MTTRRQDSIAVLILVALWLLFFWRLFTPISGDQASITEGDFSGQFVTFAAYQYNRFTAGEVPLWNPYNNGGFPFIGDTQAAVFYPPRLVTIALSALVGGWTYHALELEMTFHVLLYSLMMYALVRRMTLGQTGSVIGGLVAAIIACYGGFLTGYPPQQLAILEAATWLPLGVLGILEATRTEAIRWRWLVLAGFALGLSWMAGHPQTSWFMTYLLVAFLAYRLYRHRQPWPRFVAGTLLIGLISGGMAAVQLIPGAEYLMHTARPDLTYAAKGNGFPIRDVLQLLFPGQLSLFSPLYIGIVGLALVLVLLWLRENAPGSTFWFLVALVALGLSFGANTAIFPALYNLLPGLRFFRGQERAAYLVANSLAILAGLGAAALIGLQATTEVTLRRLYRSLLGLLVACGAGIALAHTGWLGGPPEDALNTAMFSTLIAAGAFVILRGILRTSSLWPYGWLLVGLLVFDLFSINMDTSSTYDPVPPHTHIEPAPPFADVVLADTDGPFRVDGFRGLTDNYGSLYSIPDMRGISPLFLNIPFQIIEPEKINPLAWELFAVRYVYTDWQQLPVSSEVIGSGEDRYGNFSLHRLDDPRLFAHLLYQADIVDSDAFALALLRDPNFAPRQSVILNQAPDINLPSSPPAQPGTAAVTTFEPERIVVTVNTPADAILSLAHPHYPGWHATLDGQPVPLLRAYGALSAVAVPAGQHDLLLVYDPASYRIGAILSLVTWAGLGILSLYWWIGSRNRHADSP